MIEKMNRFKQLDIVVNWMLSIFFVLLAGANFLFARQLLALLSLVPAIGLFPPLKSSPVFRLVMLVIGVFVMVLS